MLQNILTRLSLKIQDGWVQYYDGASGISGKKVEVANFDGRVLNLTVKDAYWIVTTLKETFEIIRVARGIFKTLSNI